MSGDSTRRDFLKLISAGSAGLALSACGTPSSTSGASPRVVIIGGGFGGATAAKYLKLWGDSPVDVTLVERGAGLVSCPQSNLVLAGLKPITDLMQGYDGLRRRGIRVITDEATAVDVEHRVVRLSGNAPPLPYDYLVISPGVDFMYEDIPALLDPEVRRSLVHAWKAGPETVTLRRQLQAMPDGGVCIVSVPRQPFRCPPGPYERACQIAHYFRAEKPHSKVLLLDANEDIISKKALFTAAWNDLYKGLIEYQPNQEVRDVDLRERTVKTDFDSFRGDVINIIPPQRAGAIATTAHLVTANNRWCGVDWQTMQSVAVPGVYVLGDATLSAPAMPKSASMANSHAKIAAAAILASMAGDTIDPAPVITNTCYSYVSDTEAMHVNAVYRYDPAKKTLATVPGSGGLSPRRSREEKNYADAWAQNIRADALD